MRAGLLRLHDAERRALLGHDIPAAAAVRAGFGRRALGRAAAAAVRAGFLAVDRDLFGAAVGGFLKGQNHAGLDIVAFARGVGAAAPAAAKTAEPAEAPAEQIAEDIAQVHAAETARAAKAALLGRIVGVDPGKAELVVALAFFGVGEHVVGFVDLLELFLGHFIAGVEVGVVFLGELAVGALDLGVAGIFADAQHLVVISFFCHRITP